MRKIPLALLCARGVFFVSHGIVFFLSRNARNSRNYASRAIRFFSPTDDTDNTDFSSSLFLMRCCCARRATDLHRFYSSGVVVSHGSFFSLTECTELTEMPMLRRLRYYRGCGAKKKQQASCV